MCVYIKPIYKFIITGQPLPAYDSLNTRKTSLVALVVIGRFANSFISCNLTNTLIEEAEIGELGDESSVRFKRRRQGFDYEP